MSSSATRSLVKNWQTAFVFAQSWLAGGTLSAGTVDKLAEQAPKPFALSLGWESCLPCDSPLRS